MKNSKKPFGYSKINDLKRLQFIIDILDKNLSKDAKVLDVGCGNGIISINLGAEGFKVLGIDVSPKAIDKASSTNTYSNVSFKNVSAEELVAQGEKYDAVICSEILEHLEKPEELLVKLHQSLNEDGVLIVTVPNGTGPRELLITRPMIQIRKNKSAWNFVNRVKKLLGYSGSTIQSDADNLDHIQFFTKKAIKKLSESNGFGITKFRNADFMEEVFPFSILSRRSKFIQRLDCKVADILPNQMASGFLMEWRKR